MAKKNELMVAASDTQLAQLASGLPQGEGFTRILTPRFGMVSQDILKEEGVGKNKKVTLETAEGAFFTEHETDETITREDGTEAKEWQKDFLDEENPEVIILFQRKQLRYYDTGEEKYTSSPIFDRDDEQVVLFKDRKEVARGTIAELKALYPAVSKKTGKATSDLKDVAILYVLYNGELMQMNLHGTSLWSFQSYKRKVAPPTVITLLGAEHCEQGDTKWSKVTFSAKRPLSKDEADLAIEKVTEIKEAIAGEKAYFSAQNGDSKVDEQFEALTAPEKKVF